MAGLVLNLMPYEKFLVGGIVLQNGQRRSQLRVVDGGAGVLRLSDALHPNDVKTPLTRAYYAAQTMIVGDTTGPEAKPILIRLLAEAVEGFAGFSFHEAIAKAAAEAEKGKYYKVLKILRPLLAQEATVLLTLTKSGDAVNH